MSVRKRGLGKGLSDLGLSALLGDLQTAAIPVRESIASPAALLMSDTVATDGQLKQLSLTILQPGKYQPRKFIAPEALEELANSIRTQGVIQPIVVRAMANQQYEIIAGERRFRAAKLAGLHSIPAIIRDISDETAMVMALIENIQRRDLNAMEEAFALNRLMQEFQMTHDAIAQAVGKSRTAVTNLLRLLKLPQDVRVLVENGQLEMGHARALLILNDVQQSVTAHLIVSRGLSVRATEDLIRKTQQAADNQKNVTDNKITLHTLQDRLSQKFGIKVFVTQNAKGRGKLVISYKNEKELASILAKLNEGPFCNSG